MVVTVNHVLLYRYLRELIIAHRNDSTLPLNPLTMKLNGILDAAVMGGVTKYENAFFTSEYLMNHEEDEQLIEMLKDLMASQIPLLDIGVKVHSARAPPSLTPLQLRFEDCFEKMKLHIEENYGKKVRKTYIINSKWVIIERKSIVF